MTTTPATAAVATTTDQTPLRDARPPRPGVSVRVRITATVALLATVALALAGLIVYVVEGRRVDDRTVASAQQDLDAFADGLSRANGTGETLKATLKLFVRRNVPDPHECLIGFVGAVPEVGTPDPDTGEPDPLVADAEFRSTVMDLLDRGDSTATMDTGRGDVLISLQPVRQGDESGALVVVSYLEPDRVGLRDTMRTYAIVAALSLLMIVGFAFVQAGRLLGPLRAVRQTADEISDSDLSRRLPVRGNDDITALTRTFNGMLDRLEASFTGQRQLLDDAGHELRTPLTVLQGHLELLDVGDPVEVAETRDLLLDEVDRMARLVNDLILLAKTDRPDFLDVAPVDVDQLTRTVLAKAGGLAERDWQLDQTATVTARGDEQRITQALLQLAHNAVKHTGPGDTIALGSVVDGASVLWWVRDTGPGVPAGDRERIFERFGRGADEEQHEDGFGLGLSIVAAIARAHGGSAWLDASYDEGARFVVSVPYDAPPAPPSYDDVPADDTRPLSVAGAR